MPTGLGKKPSGTFVSGSSLPSMSPAAISAGGPRLALPGPNVSKGDSPKKNTYCRFRITGSFMKRSSFRILSARSMFFTAPPPPASSAAIRNCTVVSSGVM